MLCQTISPRGARRKNAIQSRPGAKRATGTAALCETELKPERARRRDANAVEPSATIRHLAVGIRPVGIRRKNARAFRRPGQGDRLTWPQIIDLTARRPNRDRER